MTSKYHNVKVKVDGYTFDSKAEAERYAVLKLLEATGEIQKLEIHPKYPIVISGIKICTYIADFRYRLMVDPAYNHQGYNVITEDVKGVKTAVYSIKKKLMKAIYGIDVLETRGSK